MTTVIFRPAAALEFQEARGWYEVRGDGLGEEFVRCVDACVQTIRRHPELYPVVHRGIRQAVLRRFPYAVLYLLAGERIIVISVFHSSRDPKIWKVRS